MPRIHPTAEVSPKAQIGEGTSIWNQAQVREDVVIGENCTLSKDVYVDPGVVIGSNVKVQNGVSIYHGVTIEDGVFVGPHACFTNDKYPRAVNPDGSLKGSADWQVSEILIRQGAALGARSLVLPGVIVGKWAMVAAGAVVTRNVPDFGLVMGHPARLRWFVCPCGLRLEQISTEGDTVHTQCSGCETQIDIPLSDWQQIV